MSERLYSVHQVAEMLGATPGAVNEWIEKGWLACQHSHSRPRQLTESSLAAFLDQRGMDSQNILARARGQEQAAAVRTLRPGGGSRISLAASGLLAAGPMPVPVQHRPADFSSPAPAGHADRSHAPAPPTARQAASPAGQHSSAQGAPPAESSAQISQTLLRDALARRATHIHVECAPDGLACRLRVDGILQDRTVLKLRQSRQAATKVIGHFKFLAGMPLEPSPKPAQGRFSLTIDGQEADFSVQTFPTIQGETLLLTVQERQRPLLNLSRLGMEEQDEGIVRGMIAQPCGLIVVVGPPGSGRGTTLRAMLQAAQTPGRGAISLERSAAISLPGVQQAVAGDGLSYADALAAYARHDAEVIMAEEIRDGRSARACLAAAAEGKLVLASMHARSAGSAISMLAELNEDSYLLSSLLLGVVEQRLVRRLCPDCRGPDSPDQDALANLWLGAADIRFPVYTSGGCGRCFNTGLSGRVGVFSIIEIDELLAGMIRRGSDGVSVVQSAWEHGAKTLHQDAVDKLRSGLTSLVELARAMPY